MIKTPVCILTRTSGRPAFFARLRETIAELNWPVIHIVHTDDPRDTYVDGDIIIRGESTLDQGRGAYNLYNNRLAAVAAELPISAWCHFMDDDDEYVDPDCFRKMLSVKPHPRHILLGRVERWHGKDGQRVVYPSAWRKQQSYQTECFMVHNSRLLIGKWPRRKKGDHTYSARLTRNLKQIWVEDVFLARAQEGKGHGYRNDATGAVVDIPRLPGDHSVWVKPLHTGSFPAAAVPYARAVKVPGALITFRGAEVIWNTDKVSPPGEIDIEPCAGATGEVALLLQHAGYHKDILAAAGIYTSAKVRPTRKGATK